MGGRLALAKTRLQSVDVAPRDPPTDPGDLAPLVETASSLADKHQKMADGVDAAAGGALQDAQQGLSLMRTLQNRENKVQELIGDLKALYESSGAEAQSLDRRAVRLGEEAGAESKMAADMLKQIARLEKNLPESMKDWGDAVRARLDPLRDSVDGEVSDLQELQTTVKGDQQDAQDLLDQGKAAQQEFTGLLDRVQEAKEETERALKTISDNRQELDQTLRDLRGFEEQVSAGRAEADQAVSRLPGVQTSIRQAENRNQQTGQVLRDLQPEASGAMGAIGLLQEQLDLLQGVAPPPGGGGLAADGARLGAAVQDLRARSERTGGGAAAALEDARQEGAGAAEAAVAAAEALSSAKNSRDAVARTLREVHALLASTNKTGQVDPTRLGALEALVSSQQQEVSGLGPRLLKVQVLEADRIRDLDRLDRDLDQVLADIQNLEEVLRAVPEGCYNSPPIEEA
ncbi:laminin subunit gamma-1-like isoform 3-T5 [Menidia menidia]